MNLFRSEEHLERWLEDREPGGTTSAGNLCQLAYAWYGDRLDPDWQPRTVEQNQRILDDLGLTGEFWRLS